MYMTTSASRDQVRDPNPLDWLSEMVSPADVTTRIRKPGCTPCRERHVRCDRAQPTCSSCRRARASLRCEYSTNTLRLKPSVYSSESSSERSSTKVDVPSGFADGLSSTHIEPRRLSEETQGFSPEASCGWPHDDTSVQAMGLLTPEPINSVGTLGRDSEDGQSFETIQSSNPSSPMHSPEVFAQQSLATFRRTVTDSLDARVFGFYVKNGGPWLDIVSPSRYFGDTVPRIALGDSALYYACLACAARVLMLRGELEKSKGASYEDKAIAALIPRLSLQTAKSQHDSLPATIVILRMAEQFSEVQDDARCHLLGASSLFASHPENASLGAAAFWVYMRQSIRAAFLNEEPCKFEAASLTGEISVSPASDMVWANRSTFILARTCSACWDGSLDSDTRLKLLDDLCVLLEQWRQNLPETFQPWSEFRAENDPFPNICFISAWHVVAWQYYYATKVLIGLYRKPRDMTVFEISRHAEAEILTPTRLLCAITFSSDDVGATINGTHLVSWCGQVFTGSEDQQRLLEFLETFMQLTKWPNQTCCDRLRRIWKGDSISWVSP